MTVIVKDFTPQLISSIGNRADLAVELAARDVARKGSLKAPKDKGSLAQRVELRKLGNAKQEVAWRMPYAQYQERGKRRDGSRVVRRYTTPGTGKGFARKAANEVSDDFRTYARRAGL